MPASRGRRFHAPADDGTALFDPPLSQVAQLVTRNAVALEAFDQLKCLPQGFRNAARKSLLQRLIGVCDAFSSDTILKPLILTGHQPELYHPGVWLKNFAADVIAKSLNGRALNLLVDNDLCRHASIKVPSGTANSSIVESVCFDASAAPVPWEARRIERLELFTRFSAEVRRSFGENLKLSQYANGMVLDDLWPRVLDHLKASTGAGALADCLMYGRREMELQAGLTLSDCPLSAVADSNEFVQFAGHLLAHHSQFREVYNAALTEYRHQNQIRSHTHPVPELAQEGEWVEVAFWIWTHDEPQRKRAFVRRSGNHLELSDRGSVAASLPSGDSADYSQAGDTLRERGIRLRPRALITTMYARLVLSDLFVHGIGGAKYDELTDSIIRRFFGIEPPEYLTATATFRLPIDRPQASLEDVRTSGMRLRELRYRPESFTNDVRMLGDNDLGQRLTALAAEKRDYLAAHELRRCSRAVFARLDKLNEQMYELLEPLERELLAKHGQLFTQFKDAQLLSSREFSFVLFPSEILSARLLDLCKLLS